LGAVTGTAPGPNTALIAAASARSAAGVPVASAKTTSISAGDTSASASASSIARRSPGGRGEPGGGSKVAA
jgi:hypothetical protein